MLADFFICYSFWVVWSTALLLSTTLTILVNCYIGNNDNTLLITMESPDTSHPRAPQKGIGSYRSKSVEQEAARAAVSVRRWWWEFLRLSKDYWFACQTTKGRIASIRDQTFSKVYRDFGNIYDCTFEQWWIDQGAYIFHEETEAPKVREIEGNYRSIERHRHREGKILIEIPIVLTKRTVQNQVGKILKRYEEQRPANVLETSTSRYPINPVRYQLQTLQRMHEVWCLHRELILKPRALGIKPDPRQEKNDLFRIGKLLNLNYAYARPHEDEFEMRSNQRKMRVIVSRYLRRANQLIANVERGVFPVYKNVAVEPRFSRSQLESHQALEEAWWHTDLFSKLTTKSAADAKRIYCSFYSIV